MPIWSRRAAIAILFVVMWLFTIAFLVPDRKRRDRANLIQSCKPIIDGICDAGIVEGDHWEVMSIGEVTVNVSPVKSSRCECRLKSSPNRRSFSVAILNFYTFGEFTVQFNCDHAEHDLTLTAGCEYPRRLRGSM
jgi:hypothetical protein